MLRAVDSFDGSAQGFERASYRSKVLWIVEPTTFHEVVAEALSIRIARRDSRRGGPMGGAGDGVSEAPRSKWSRSGQCCVP